MIGERVRIGLEKYSCDYFFYIFSLQMAPIIQKFLVEGSSLVTYAGRDKESLIQVTGKSQA